jgi:hypothetical protein
MNHASEGSTAKALSILDVSGEETGKNRLTMLHAVLREGGHDPCC